MAFFVYMLASRRNGTLYIGMTDDLVRRTYEHRIGAVPGFTKRYGVKLLVWYEMHETRESAFARERQLKKWNRTWKLQLSRKQIRHGAISGRKFVVDFLVADGTNEPHPPLIPAQAGIQSQGTQPHQIS